MPNKLDRQRAAAVVAQYFASCDHDEYRSVSPSDLLLSPAEFGRAISTLIEAGVIDGVSLSGDGLTRNISEALRAASEVKP